MRTMFRLSSFLGARDSRSSRRRRLLDRQVRPDAAAIATLAGFLVDPARQTWALPPARLVISRAAPNRTLCSRCAGVGDRARRPAYGRARRCLSCDGPAAGEEGRKTAPLMPAFRCASLLGERHATTTAEWQ